jgi:uncharacterized protein (UPF0332 family)
MSDLQNKAEINLDSAKILHGKGNYPSVAHCTYYACYQLVKHIWLHKIGKSEDELNALCKEKKREGSHEVLINQIGSFIKNSTNKNKIDDFRVVNYNLVALKKLRVKADYKDVNFDSVDSSNALSLSNSVIPLLKKYQ